MKRRSALILGLAAVMIGGAGGFLCYVQAHQRLGKPGVRLVPEPMYDVQGRVVGSNSVYLPPGVLNCTSEIVPIDESVLRWLPKDTTYGQRLYKAPDGFQMRMSVVLMGTDRTSIHRPQFCLPAQGWTIQREEAVGIPVTLPSPFVLPVMKLTARQEKQLPSGEKVVGQGLNVYWFVCDHQLTAEHGHYMWSILKHMLLTGELQRWAFVTCFSPCPPGQEGAVFERMKQVIAEAVPQFQLAAGPRARAAMNLSKH